MKNLKKVVRDAVKKFLKFVISVIDTVYQYSRRDSSFQNFLQPEYIQHMKENWFLRVSILYGGLSSFCFLTTYTYYRAFKHYYFALHDFSYCYTFMFNVGSYFVEAILFTIFLLAFLPLYTVYAIDSKLELRLKDKLSNGHFASIVIVPIILFLIVIISAFGQYMKLTHYFYLSIFGILLFVGIAGILFRTRARWMTTALFMFSLIGIPLGKWLADVGIYGHIHLEKNGNTVFDAQNKTHRLIGQDSEKYIFLRNRDSTTISVNKVEVEREYIPKSD